MVAADALAALMLDRIFFAAIRAQAENGKQ